MIKQNTMKKFLRGFALALLIGLSTSCAWLFQTGSNGNGGNVTLGTPVMKNSYTMIATAAQVDSICVVDTLPNIDTWLGASFTDYETGEKIIKRMYFKNWGKTEIVYTITGNKEPYNVSMRITK